MNPINQIIAEGKRLCEGKDMPPKYWRYQKRVHEKALPSGNDFVYHWVEYCDDGKFNPEDCYDLADYHSEEWAKFVAFHNPSQMKHLYEILEKAVRLAEHFKDHGHFEYNEEGQEVDVYPAREFLASIEKRDVE